MEDDQCGKMVGLGFFSSSEFEKNTSSQLTIDFKIKGLDALFVYVFNYQVCIHITNRGDM